MTSAGFAPTAPGASVHVGGDAPAWSDRGCRTSARASRRRCRAARSGRSCAAVRRRRCARQVGAAPAFVVVRHVGRGHVDRAVDEQRLGHRPDSEFAPPWLARHHCVSTATAPAVCGEAISAAAHRVVARRAGDRRGAGGAAGAAHRRGDLFARRRDVPASTAAVACGSAAGKLAMSLIAPTRKLREAAEMIGFSLPSARSACSGSGRSCRPRTR